MTSEQWAHACLQTLNPQHDTQNLWTDCADCNPHYLVQITISLKGH